MRVENLEKFEAGGAGYKGKIEEGKEGKEANLNGAFIIFFYLFSF